MLKTLYSKLYIFLENHRYEIAVFVFLFIQLFSKTPLIGGWEQDPSYLFSYTKTGLLSRSLLGTFVYLINGDAFITREFLWFFVNALYLILILLVSLVLGKIIKKSQEEFKLFSVFAAILYLSMPASVYDAFTNVNPDFALLLFLFLFLAVMIYEKTFFRSAIPFICFALIASHLFSAFFYIPAILIILFFDAYRNSAVGTPKDIKTTNKISVLRRFCLQNGKRFLLFISSAFVSAGIFIYFSFFSKRIFIGKAAPEQIADKLPASFFSPSEIMSRVEAEFFWNLSDHYLGYTANLAGNIFQIIIFIVFSAPLIFLILYFWTTVIKDESDKVKKILFVISALIPFMSLIIFLIFIDWMRYMSFILNAQFVLIFYYFNLKEHSVLNAAYKLIEVGKKHFFLFLMLPIYLLALGRIGDDFAHGLVLRIKMLLVHLHIFKDLYIGP